MRARRVVLVLVLAAACRRQGGVTPAAPVMPDVPVAVRPASGAAVDSRTPTFVVANARGFDAGQATYEFQVLDGAALAVVEDIRDVPAGAGQTEATAPIALVRGAGYQWKAIAHAGDRQASVGRGELSVPEGRHAQRRRGHRRDPGIACSELN